MENFISCIRKNMDNDVISNYPRKDADYLERLKSFEQIEDFPISKEKAAIAGFEYIGPEDRLRCVYCDGQLESWAPTDDPLRAHIDNFPTCPFLIPLLTHPTNRSMSSYDERLASFSSWGRRCPSAEDLAAAGFYKSKKRGFPDSVKCFFCGLPLHSWEAGDLPWEEHARRVPSYFLDERLKKI